MMGSRPHLPTAPDLHSHPSTPESSFFHTFQFRVFFCVYYIPSLSGVIYISWKPTKDGAVKGQQTDRKRLKKGRMKDSSLKTIFHSSFLYPFPILLRSHPFPIIFQFSALVNGLTGWSDYAAFVVFKVFVAFSCLHAIFSDCFARLSLSCPTSSALWSLKW